MVLVKGCEWGMMGVFWAEEGLLADLPLKSGGSAMGARMDADTAEEEDAASGTAGAELLAEKDAEDALANLNKQSFSDRDAQLNNHTPHTHNHKLRLLAFTHLESIAPLILAIEVLMFALLAAMLCGSNPPTKLAAALWVGVGGCSMDDDVAVSTTLGVLLLLGDRW